MRTLCTRVCTNALQSFTYILQTSRITVCSSSNVLNAHVHSWFSAVVNENVSLVISRQLLTDVGNHLNTLPDDVSKLVSHFTLDKVQPRVVSFEEQASERGHGVVPTTTLISLCAIKLILQNVRNKKKLQCIVDCLASTKM